MRFLQQSDIGEFSLTKDCFGDDQIPRYAILSHTWGSDVDEVTFEDLKSSTGKHKAGYEKIRFCGEQARQDGLQYFWIDTCCINKANYAELSQAINSMFRWYRDASRCYVYLSDVSISKQSSEFTWEPSFRGCRWFTRGWTLQELLAPQTVEFFSVERTRLGDKSSLRQQIHEITGISELALQGAPLSGFSVNERLSWMERRRTKLEEDRVYSLLGIFGVYIPPIYNEGVANAFRRLQDEIDKLEKCIQDLRLTDPRDDKKRIEDTKGGLLQESYRWILQNPDFQQWHHGHHSRLLWIKGDPGKGKTMLLCGIANELEKSKAQTDLISFFFCQATDSRINNASAVLRGLIFLLLNQQPSLISHIRKKHDHAGKTLFEDTNSWYALSEIFTNILQDPSLNRTFLIIDALDECVSDLPKLLDFIAQKSSVTPRVKWVVSSRNWPDIQERLDIAGYKMGLSLELNAESVSGAVSIYIQHKMLLLAQRKKYNTELRDAVQDHLSSNANNTFLWVALVCQNLEKIPRWNTLAKLNTFPPGLGSLYKRMVEQICNSDNAGLCKRILATIANVYQPITLKELTSLVEMVEDKLDDLESLSEIVALCGSFLTIRQDTIYFVHHSARDYLLQKALDKVFPLRGGEAHYMIVSMSLQVMSRTLRRDIYSLHALGYPIERVKQPDPDPLAAIRYSCIHWVNHLCDWSSTSCVDHRVDLQGGGIVDIFIREKYLYWLEALSLYRSVSEGVLSMARLDAIVQVILGLVYYL
jgi:hypothetical protein